MADTDTWDAEDFEPTLPQTRTVTDKWDGEDEDDDVKENWADSEDEEKKDQDGKTESQAYQRPKKKPLADRIAEKEAQRKKEEEEKARLKEEKRELTAEEKLAEKIRLKKIQEEGDLSLAKGLFGLSECSIDKMIPTTEEEFKQFGEAVKSKLTSFEESKYYPAFVEKLVSDLALGLSADDVKKLGVNISNLYHEKERQRKEQDKKKKKKSKATIKMDRPDDFDLIGDASGSYGYDDDDFI